MSYLVEYAKSELARIGASDKVEDMMNEHIITMVQAFADEGHSVFSAQYAVQILERLLRYLPLTPLTGEEDEWHEYAKGKYQNKRCPTVFRDTTGTCDINGYVFSNDGGRTWYTNKYSEKVIGFPYYPPTKPTRVYRPAEPYPADSKPLEGKQHDFIIR